MSYTLQSNSLLNTEKKSQFLRHHGKGQQLPTPHFIPPKYCKTGGPYGEFLRIRRNCNILDDDYNKHSEERVHDYLRRGYTEKIQREAQSKAGKIDRKTLINNNEHKKDNNRNIKTPLIVTYIPANPNSINYWKNIGTS